MADDKPKKNFCYLDKCKAKLTGFRWDDWMVCSYCKQELSSSLYKIIKDRQDKKDKKEDHDSLGLWDTH